MRDGSEVSMGHVFPQGVLAAITLVRGRLEMEGLEPEPGVMRRRLCSMADSNILGAGGEGSQGAGAEHLVWVQGVSIPSKCVLSPSQCWHFSLTGEQCWS